ncbi:SDR family oxidoreductase [Pseudomaricurvus sp.]|uniref:SDR family oxidoreductase n=1 Tax=Pseudomaricurvus sp. TaxID=2004510 RepID=UPI003F6C25FC
MNDTLQSLFSLKNRVALVTGGTSGVGAMLARGLLIAGARVFITGRNVQAGESQASAMSELGPCEFIQTDLTDPQAPKQLQSYLSQHAPDLSILINNAGMTDRAAWGEFTEEQVDEILSLNVKAPFLVAQALHPLLKQNASQQSPAHIINTGSIAGLNSHSASFIYGPSKAALHHLTRVLAKSLGPDHICVNAIAPGLFPSKMTEALVSNKERQKQTTSRTPAGRMGEPNDLAILIIALVSSSYMTGNLIPIDGGLTV